MIVHILILVSGFVILIKGAAWLVDGGSALARKHNIPELAIGLTIVAFGTSLPELVVNVFAAYQSHSDIVYGNIIGSNIFNLFVILGFAGLVFPLNVRAGTVWKEIPFSFFAVLLLYFLSNSIVSDDSILSRTDAVILLIFFGLFIWYVFRQLKNETLHPDLGQRDLSNSRIWLLIIPGLVFLIAGGRLVVVNSVRIAQDLGMSEKIIAFTIVAAGTSLPELATSVVASVKRNNEIAIGNVIGSNIYNILFILGISALIKPVSYNVRFNPDIYLLGSGTILLFLVMFSGKKMRLERWESGILLMIYVLYTTYLIIKDL